MRKRNSTLSDTISVWHQLLDSKPYRGFTPKALRKIMQRVIKGTKREQAKARKEKKHIQNVLRGLCSRGVKKADAKWFGTQMYLGKECFLCFSAMTMMEASADHSVPLSKGGSNDLTNLQWVHKACNLQKGDMDLVSYRIMVTVLGQNLKKETVDRILMRLRMSGYGYRR